MKRHFHARAVVRHPETFHRMQLVRMRSFKIVDKGARRDSDGIDDQCIAFVMPDGFAEPRRRRMRAVRDIQIDVTDLVIRLPHHDDLFRRLDEINRLNRVEQESRRADRPAARLRKGDRLGKPPGIGRYELSQVASGPLHSGALQLVALIDCCDGSLNL